MKRLSQLSFLLFALFVILGAATVSVQAATLKVTVTDVQTGDQLNGVSITVTPARGTVVTGLSDTNGALDLTGLAAGDYTVTAFLQGYTRKVITNVTLTTDGTESLEISLSSDVIELEQVSITASRRQEKVLEAPASVAIVSDSEIMDRVAPSVTEHLKSVRAVDVVTSGVGSSYVVVRGFNNVFSGTLLSLVDNRIASVPSLRANVYTLIPTVNEDIEKIEVVSGPGAALYGPNSADGVVHILTRSPFNSQGTTLSLGGGEQNLIIGSLRHAGVINETLGYKLSANYTQANDWEEGRVKEDTEVELSDTEKDALFDIQAARGEFRVDYKPTVDTTVILASGLTQTTGIELTGLGAGKAKNWTYGYAQARFIHKDLFAQAFWNRSDAGDTYLLRTGEPIVDKSDLYVGQIQHSYGFGDVQRFTYGLDVLLTRPDTEGTINGKNEEEDNINEIGLYLQSETNILPQLKLLAAGRADNHNHLNDIILSPRVALALQPTDNHNLRVTYNRAFSTPGTSNLFLDIRSAKDAFGLGANFEPALGFAPSIDIRGQGVPSESGFTFKRSENGLPMFRSAFSPVANLEADAYIPLHDPKFTNVMWGVGRGAVLGGFKAELSKQINAETLPALLLQQPPEAIQAIVAGLPPAVIQLLPATLQQPGAIATLSQEELQLLIPQVLQGLPEPVVAQLASTMVEDISNGFAGVVPEQVVGLKNVLRSLNPETGQFIDVEDVNDVESLQPTITQTYEVGYKGILMNRVAFSIDVYHSRINNFVSPLFVETPNVFLDATAIGETFGPQLAAALEDPQNAMLKQSLLALDSKDAGGNGNGSPVDEVIKRFASIPFGTVTPEQAADPNAVMLTYRNQGDISLNGADLSVTLFLTPDLSLGANYSFVSEDYFEKVDGVNDIALNAPTNKFGANVQYTNRQLGLGVGLRARYVQGFPVKSGVYIGEVESYSIIDLSAGYDLPIPYKPRVSLTVQNLLDHKHQQFFGTPEIGRLAMIRLTQTF